jgi:hypothetical protein
MRGYFILFRFNSPAEIFRKIESAVQRERLRDFHERKEFESHSRQLSLSISEIFGKHSSAVDFISQFRSKCKKLCRRLESELHIVFTSPKDKHTTKVLFPSFSSNSEGSVVDCSKINLTHFGSEHTLNLLWSGGVDSYYHP